MKVSVIYDPNPELGSDPLDRHEMPRRQGDFIGDNDDCLVVWREYGEQFEDGFRTHVVAQGVYENVRSDAVDQILGLLAPTLDE